MQNRQKDDMMLLKKVYHSFERSDTMSTIGMIVGTGFEEIEALATVDVLRRAGITVKTLGVDHVLVTGSHDITIQTDGLLSDEEELYDGIIIPGGPGVETLVENDTVLRMVQSHYQQGKWCAAICAAPKVLYQAGILAGKRYTCYPSVQQEILEGEYVQENVVVDGRVITSKSAGTAMEFALEIARQLGADALAVSQSMYYDWGV